MTEHEIVIIGGGPAGLAAAAAAKKSGVSDILILERDSCLGGILNQCIHNGFGLHTFKEELTGPEYAARYIDMIQEEKIPFKLNTMVIDISRDRVVTAVNREDGLFSVKAGAVILAMGCRERPRGALNIPGYRPAGIYSAGTAQRLMNMEGCSVGRKVVILGSGDIGLIMARRMTLEGAEVKVVAELMPYSGGLKRNIVQCLDDYGIPLKLSHTVVNIHGKRRVTGVTLAQVGTDRKMIPGTEEYYACDTLLLSVGLIPENELSKGMGVSISPATSGPEVNDCLETSVKGVFACGNVLHVHDLVDYVSEEAARAGESGRGFAVVAGQIKKLAEQSDQSSQEIEQIASTLIRESSLAVESMQSMQQIITSQSESMAETQNIVKEVLGEIGNSMQSIRQIKASTQRLEDSRNEVVQAVGELSGIAEENVESTKKTYDGTQEVVETFQQVYVSAEQLREISDKLVKGIGYFHI